MKKRLDLILVERELASTRTRAQALIAVGGVSSDGHILDKPGVQYDEAIDLQIEQQPQYVSRAGDKLASIAGEFELNFEGKTVLDVGSSTGGFTDFALQHGAAKVYCVDVGTNQLADKLRQDVRVVIMEQTDIRDAQLPKLADIGVMDVSFISLTKVLEATAALVKLGAPIVAMAKPQFEAGKLLSGRYHGVIPTGKPRDGILAELRNWIGERFVIEGEADSGLAGAEGNIERFFLLRSRSV